MTRFVAIISFEPDGDVEDARTFAKRLRLWTPAESLGSVKSLFCHSPTMTHASVEPEVRRKVGINDSLIRLSVGLEDVRNLIDDLEQALEGDGAADGPANGTAAVLQEEASSCNV